VTRSRAGQLQKELQAMMNPPSLTTASDDDGSDADESGGAAGKGPAMSDSDSAGQVSDDDDEESEADEAAAHEGNVHGGTAAGGPVSGGALAGSTAAGGGYLCALVRRLLPAARRRPPASRRPPPALARARLRSPAAWRQPNGRRRRALRGRLVLLVWRARAARRASPALAGPPGRPRGPSSTSHTGGGAQEYERQTKPSSLSWKSIKLADEERVAACMQKLPRLCAAGEAALRLRRVRLAAPVR